MLRWIVTYPVDKVIRSLNNWGQVYERTWLGLLLFCLFFFFWLQPIVCGFSGAETRYVISKQQVSHPGFAQFYSTFYKICFRAVLIERRKSFRVCFTTLALTG